MASACARSAPSPLTTRDCADFMGLSSEFIRQAIDDGVAVQDTRVRLEAESLDLGSRRVHRIHLDAFITFLKAIGWKRLPVAA